MAGRRASWVGLWRCECPHGHENGWVARVSVRSVFDLAELVRVSVFLCGSAGLSRVSFFPSPRFLLRPFKLLTGIYGQNVLRLCAETCRKTLGIADRPRGRVNPLMATGGVRAKGSVSGGGSDNKGGNALVVSDWDGSRMIHLVIFGVW